VGWTEGGLFRRDRGKKIRSGKFGGVGGTECLFQLLDGKATFTESVEGLERESFQGAKGGPTSPSE